MTRQESATTCRRRRPLGEPVGPERHQDRGVRMARRLPTRAALVTAVVGIGALAASMSPGATAAGHFTPKWNIANAGRFGAERSLASDPKGVLYDMTPSGGMRTYRSTDHGRTWKTTGGRGAHKREGMTTTTPARPR